jgi:hypothetical protein
MPLPKTSACRFAEVQYNQGMSVCLDGEKPWGSNNYSDYEVWQMEEDDTEVLTPEEQQKTLKDIPKEQQQKDENEKD